MVRPADPVDGATPAGASLITEAIITAAHLVDADHAERYVAAGDAALRAHTPLLARAARSAGHWLGRRRGDGSGSAAGRGGLRCRRLATVDGGTPAGARAARSSSEVRLNSSELLVGRDRIAGADAAYVCRGRVCDLPVTSAGDLASALSPRRVACGP